MSSKLNVTGHVKPPLRKRDRSAVVDDVVEVVAMPSEEAVVGKKPSAKSDHVQDAGTAVSVKQPDSSKNVVNTSKKSKKQKQVSPTAASKEKPVKEATHVDADDAKEQLVDYDDHVHPDAGESPADR